MLIWVSSRDDATEVFASADGNREGEYFARTFLPESLLSF